MGNSPFDVNILPGCRRLTEYEQNSMLKAIEWLHKKGISYKDIVHLCQERVDREAKMVVFDIETKRFTIKRAIKYANSPLDSYLTEVLPCLKVRPIVFPHSAGTGRKKVFGFNVKADKIEAYFRKEKSKKRLNIMGWCVIMKTSHTGVEP